MRTGQKFGDWVVVDPECYEYSKNSVKRILCYDPIANDLTFVNKYNLLHGLSTKSILRRNELKCGHTTRYIHNRLPKYIQYTQNPLNKRKYRVVRNTKDLGYKTYGYFKELKDAKLFVKENVELLGLTKLATNEVQ